MMSKKERILAEAQRKAKKLTSDDEIPIRCKLCNNQTTDEHLERHIKYNHIISDDEMFYKLFNMHFPGKFPENGKDKDTQTSITWIGDEIVDSEKVVNGSEETNDPMEDSSSMRSTNLKCTTCEKVWEDKGELSNVLECPSCWKCSTQPASPLKLGSNENILETPNMSGTLCLSESSENRDEESMTDIEQIVTAVNTGPETENLQVEDNINKELGLTAEKNMPEDAISDNAIAKELNKASSNLSTRMDAIIVPNLVSSVKKVTTIDKILNKISRDLSPLCLRYKCPYCDEHNRKAIKVNDHIVTHHSKDLNLSSNQEPILEAREQEMKIYLPTDSDWIKECQEVSFYELPPEEREKDINNKNWIEGNPEIPKDWKFQTVENELGLRTTHYLSPCGKTFKSKQKVTDFLIKEGKKAKILFKSKCDGFCEGNCSDFVVPEYFYNENDPNKVRPRIKLSLILDKDVNLEAKVRERLVKGVPKVPETLGIAGVRYRLPGNGGERDRTNYLLEDSDHDESECEDYDSNYEDVDDDIKSVYNHSIFSELEEINGQTCVQIESAMNEDNGEQCALEEFNDQRGIQIESSVNEGIKAVPGEQSKVPQKKLRGRPKCKKKEMWTQSPSLTCPPLSSVSKSLPSPCKKEAATESTSAVTTEIETSTDTKVEKAKNEVAASMGNAAEMHATDTGKSKGKDLMDIWETNIRSKYKSRTPSGDLEDNLKDAGIDEPEITSTPVKKSAIKQVEKSYNDLEIDKDAVINEPDIATTSVKKSGTKNDSDNGGKVEVKRSSNSSKSSIENGKSTKRNSSVERNSKKRRESTDSSDKKLPTTKPNRLGLIGFDEVFQSKKSKSKSASPALEESESEEDVSDNKNKNVKKTSKIPTDEINTNTEKGIDVQCCKKKCERWHFLTEFTDISEVPKYWICSMNNDKTNNKCVKKKDVKKLVNLEYKLGNMVWAKFEDYPWWPAMVDYCPTSHEYYWIQERFSKTRPAQYNVMYFEDGEEVTWVWLQTENIKKMTSQLDPPVKSKMDPEQKVKYKGSTNKATAFLQLSRLERLERKSPEKKAHDEWNYTGDQEELNGGEDEQKTNTQRIPKLKLKRKKTETPIESNVDNDYPPNDKSKRKSIKTRELEQEKRKRTETPIEGSSDLTDHIDRSKRKYIKTNGIEQEKINEDNMENIHKTKKKKTLKCNVSEMVKNNESMDYDYIHKIKRKKPIKANDIELENKDEDNIDSDQIHKSKRSRTTKTTDIELKKQDEDNLDEYVQNRKVKRSAKTNGIELDSNVISPPKLSVRKMPGRVSSTFNCEHCSAPIPYNMQQVEFHFKDHGYTMSGYMAKYDKSDDPNLDMLRRWVNKQKPRKPAQINTSEPLKIKTEKCDENIKANEESDTSMMKSERREESSNDEVGSSRLYVEEYKQRKEREQDQTSPLIKAEDLIDTVDGSNFQSSPPVPYDVLISLSVRNMDRDNYRGASYSQIIAFICLHFPYYNRNLGELKALIKKSYNKQEADENKFRIQEEHMDNLTKRLYEYIGRKKDEVKKYMWIPDFLEVIVERFTDRTHLLTGNPAIRARPPYSRKMVLYLALISISPPSTIEQIMIFITFLFPSLENSVVQGFERKDFENDLVEEENITEIVDEFDVKTYILREGCYPEVRHNVRNYFSTISNLKQLKKSILKAEFVDLLLPNLGK